jgi:hypothetical protein
MPGVVLAVTDHDPAGSRTTTTSVPAAAERDLAREPQLLADTVRIVLDWARGRALGSSSVTGISVALALCAAGWLTEGSRSGNSWAALALAGSYLTVLAGRSLAAVPAVGSRRAGAAARAEALGKARYLASIGWSVSECAIYAGLAVGAVADRWSGIWILAIAVLAMTGIRELMTASTWPGTRDDADRGMLRRVIAEALRMPAGGRVALIAIVAPIWGGRAALLALLDWTIIAVGFGLASLQGPPRDRVKAAAAARPASQREPSGLSVLLLPAGDAAGPRLEPAAVDALEVPGDDAEQPSAGPGPGGSPFPAAAGAAIGAPGQPGARPADGLPAAEASEVDPWGRPADGLPAAEASEVGAWGQPADGPPAAEPSQADDPAQPAADPPAAEPDEAEQWRDRLLLLRDDGVLARNLGALVRGNLLPLPPALLGLAATATLAYLGMRSVPGILIISPCLIMLLAAFGSSNRHAGRLDWLVPAVLLGWQCLYLTTVGQAQRIPAPATFALCAVLLIRYADLACAGRPVIMAKRRRRNWTVELTEGERERGGALGWEGRMLLMGAAAAVGIGTLAYVALSAYLGWLICAKVLTSCLALREGDHR